MAEGKFVAYYRVSTQRQGASGLGLEAQRQAVAGYLNGGAWTLLGEFTEIESGKRDTNRPQLHAAIHLCRMTGAKLVIAKLDRLSRDAHFLIGMQKAGVPFVAVDMPDANELTVNLMAVIAQGERKAISARTKAALAVVKQRGRKLGGYRGGPVPASSTGVAGKVAKADSFAELVRPIVTEMRAGGLSLAAIASELTTRGINTPQGGAWTATAVRRVLARVAA